LVPGVLIPIRNNYQYANVTTELVPQGWQCTSTCIRLYTPAHFDTPQGFQQIGLRYTVANIKQTIGSVHDYSVTTINYSIRVCLNLRKLSKDILCASKWQGDFHLANSGMVIVS